jgi:hypothetical protein
MRLKSVAYSSATVPSPTKRNRMHVGRAGKLDSKASELFGQVRNPRALVLRLRFRLTVRGFVLDPHFPPPS